MFNKKKETEKKQNTIGSKFFMKNETKKKMNKVFKTSTDTETEETESCNGDHNSFQTDINNNNLNEKQINNSNSKPSEHLNSMFTRPDSLLKKYNFLPAGYLKVSKNSKLNNFKSSNTTQ